MGLLNNCIVVDRDDPNELSVANLIKSLMILT